MAKISKIMVTNVPALRKDAIVSDAAMLMASRPHGCVVIVDGKNPIGIVTESDLVKNMLPKKATPKKKIAEIMTSPVTTLRHDATLEKAGKIIDTKHFQRYPVVENESLVGMVTELSVVQAINDNIRFHRNVQNIVLIIFVFFEFFVFILYEKLVVFFGF